VKEVTYTLWLGKKIFLVGVITRFLEISEKGVGGFQTGFGRCKAGAILRDKLVRLIESALGEFCNRRRRWHADERGFLSQSRSFALNLFRRATMKRSLKTAQLCITSALKPVSIF
jgi:hypothetical protein